MVPRWLTIGLLAWLASACEGISTFRGQADPQSSGPQDMSRPEGSDANPRAQDALLSCFADAVEAPQDAERLVLPSRCQRQYLAGNSANRTLDVVFVLDVTGSMRSELAAVRAGVDALGAAAAREGWMLRAGAVAFADEILVAHAPEGDLGHLWSAMSPDSEVWSAPDGFGGDAPEVGLAALEKGIDLLEAADPKMAVAEKVLVYVSDAPARRLHRGNFDHSLTAARLHDLSERARTSGRSSVRLFYSSTTSRDGLMDEFPTPLAQLERLAEASGSFSTRLPFPLDAESFQSGFLERLTLESLQTETCALAEVVVRDAQTRARLIDHDAERQETWWTSHIPRSMTAGVYDVQIVRNCSHAGTETQKARLVVTRR